VKAVFGLGNPGSAYALTRHNVGFEVIDLYRKAHRLRRAGRIQDTCVVYRTGDLLLCKPLTYMNESGLAVTGVLSRYEIPPEDALVVFDELDLPLGRMKVLPSGGPGSHKGIASILATLGTERIPRLRIGIEVEGRTEPGEAFVLERFSTDEWTQVVPVLERAVGAIDLFRRSDIDAVMTQFNRRASDGC